MLDEAITSNGRMAIKFLDDSVVKLTEHSELFIDEYVYDPDPSKAKMGLTFALGTTRFISGNLAKMDKKNVRLKTPTANIFIRGTDFTATVDELGRSLIILLPDALGMSSGEIEVVTATGSVILNKPFEATTVSVFLSAPTKPVILDLTLELIDNMMIVSEPEEEVLPEDELITERKSILDFSELDVDYLAEDFLAEDVLEFTELDINYLDVNFLEDLLDELDELDEIIEEDALKTDGLAINLTGTKFGQDAETQIISLMSGGRLTLIRDVNQFARLDIDPSEAYSVILIQDGISNQLKVNGGMRSEIRIRQNDG